MAAATEERISRVLIGAGALLMASLGPSWGCSRAPSECPCDPPAEALGSDGAGPGILGLPGAETLEPSSPRARLALETAQHLFSDRYDAVRAALKPDLRDELTPEKLSGIISGVTRAHGAPERVMDAWATQIREEEVTFPAAAVLLKMSRSETRFRLLLVFDPDESLRGLWLQPI